MFRLSVVLSPYAKSTQPFERVFDLTCAISDRMEERVRENGYFRMMISIEENVTIQRSQLARAFGISEQELYKHEQTVGIAAYYGLAGKTFDLPIPNYLMTDMTLVLGLRDRLLY